MNHPYSPRSEHLFIVRVWWELDSVTATAQWRGSVQNGSGQTGAAGERRYFASWEEMAIYLAEHTADASDADRTRASHTVSRRL
ncbi:MAG: hypothetical protein BroJett021_23580 [Chloroflexota bacterium]|nr:hypothetical protein [Caldilinea sp.]GIK73370.1 MAG: hypothetical protein BroJett021_23580 [Chloroflexota bacterium]